MLSSPIPPTRLRPTFLARRGRGLVVSWVTMLVGLGLLPRVGQAHHDGPVLPLSLNAPGAVGGLANPAGQAESKFGVASRAFRVSDHALYGNPVTGGNATVLFNGLYGALALSSRLSLETLVPIVTDLPEGDGRSETGLGDVRLGGRWFLPVGQTQNVWALAAEVALPTGDATRGFGADAFVSRLSGRLSRDLANGRLRVFAEAGAAWAWEDQRGTIADLAAAGMWQAVGPLGLYLEARVLTALERGRQNPLEFVARTREPWDTSVVITPAVTASLGEHVALAIGPQIPLGFQDFDLGFSFSATYRLP